MKLTREGIKGLYTCDASVKNSPFQKTICNTSDKYTEDISDSEMYPAWLLLRFLSNCLYIVSWKIDACFLPCWL